MGGASTAITYEIIAILVPMVAAILGIVSYMSTRSANTKQSGYMQGIMTAETETIKSELRKLRDEINTHNKESMAELQIIRNDMLTLSKDVNRRIDDLYANGCRFRKQCEMIQQQPRGI